jgi:chloramphenicol-sensitive protein RarD
VRSEAAVGLGYGVAAYAFWGLVFPLHLRLLDAVAPAGLVASQPTWSLEVLSQRVVWSLVLCALLVVLRRRGPDLRRVLGTPRTVGILAVTALLVSANWLVFIYAASSGQLYRAGIGYFVTPMVQIALGTLFLRERLRRDQWAALACAGLGMIWLLLIADGLPWIELGLAGTFGLYGLLRKRVGTGPIVGLTVETAVLTPLAVGCLWWIGAGDLQRLGFFAGGPGTALLLALTGVATAVPLMWFAAAAARLPLTTIGFLQFSAPTGHFLLGVLLFGQGPPDPRLWIGYGLIWAGVAALAVGLLRFRRPR